MAELGLGAAGATLAAHILDGGNLYMTNEEAIAGYFAVWGIAPLDTEHPFTHFVLPKVAGHPHFPYGRAVPPNVPL